jgi:hypothetical protein
MITPLECGFIFSYGICNCESAFEVFCEKCPFDNVNQCPVHNPKARWPDLTCSQSR